MQWSRILLSKRSSAPPLKLAMTDGEERERLGVIAFSITYAAVSFSFIYGHLHQAYSSKPEMSITSRLRNMGRLFYAIERAKSEKSDLSYLPTSMFTGSSSSRSAC